MWDKGRQANLGWFFATEMNLFTKAERYTLEVDLMLQNTRTECDWIRLHFPVK